MAQLTANRDIGLMVDAQIREFPVEAAGHIWRGGWVGIDLAGNAKDFEKGDRLVGLAVEESDNTASGSSAGDTVCRVYVSGDFELTITSVALADQGKAVFATDDNSTTLIGNADAFVGRLLHYESANTAIVRLKAFGEMPEHGEGGSTYIHDEFRSPALVLGTSAAGLPVMIGGGLQTTALDGTGISYTEGGNGGLTGAFDATDENANAGVDGGSFLVSEGIYFAMKMHMTNIGDSALVATDWGLFETMTAALRADLAAPVSVCAFGMAGNSADILVQSDDGTTDVAPVNSTIDNVTTGGAFKLFEIVVRASGACTLWIDGTQVLSSTTFALLTTAVLSAVLNMEKPSNDTLGIWVCRSIRCTGGTG